MLTVLGLSASKNLAISDIQKAYKELCFVWHPDRFPENMRDRAEDKLKEINEAYDWLKKNFENTHREKPFTVDPKRERRAEAAHPEDHEDFFSLRLMDSPCVLTNFKRG